MFSKNQGLFCALMSVRITPSFLFPYIFFTFYRSSYMRWPIHPSSRSSSGDAIRGSLWIPPPKKKTRPLRVSWPIIAGFGHSSRATCHVWLLLPLLPLTIPLFGVKRRIYVMKRSNMRWLINHCWDRHHCPEMRSMLPLNSPKHGHNVYRVLYRLQVNFRFNFFVNFLLIFILFIFPETSAIQVQRTCYEEFRVEGDARILRKVLWPEL